LKAAFRTAESKLKSSGIDYSNSGTCAIAMFISKNMCYISNLGDSRLNFGNSLIFLFFSFLKKSCSLSSHFKRETGNWIILWP